MVEIWPLSIAPSRNDAISSPVSALNVPFWPPVSLAVEGKRSPCGEVHFAVRKGTWKKGNRIGLNSAPNFKAWLPLVMATFWMKSQTLLYSLVGSQSFAPPGYTVSAAELRQAAVQRCGGIVPPIPCREYSSVSGLA